MFSPTIYQNQPSPSSTTTATNKQPFSPRAVTVGVREVNSQRVFVYNYTKPEVEILGSIEDDRLAASMYGGIKTKSKKQKDTTNTRNDEYNFGVSGYDFDSLLKGDSSHSTNRTVRESSSSCSWHDYR